MLEDSRDVALPAEISCRLPLPLSMSAASQMAPAISPELAARRGELMGVGGDALNRDASSANETAGLLQPRAAGLEPPNADAVLGKLHLGGAEWHAGAASSTSVSGKRGVEGPPKPADVTTTWRVVDSASSKTSLGGQPLWAACPPHVFGWPMA